MSTCNSMLERCLFWCFTDFGKRTFAYAYVPDEAADYEFWEIFLENLARCIECKREKDILLADYDANLSTCKNSEPRKEHSSMLSVGKFGLSHCYKAGVRLTTFL